MIANIVVVLGTLAVAAVLFAPRVREADSWRATVTPLASIIGSGFLVSVPILVGQVGLFAIAAIAALCGLSWLVGAAVRFNIRHAEPLLKHPRQHRLIALVEHGSHLLLAFAYFISVAYYLALLSSFLLNGIGSEDPFLAKIITTIILAAIGAVGLLRGLRAVERLEIWTVGVKLAVIAGLLAGLFWRNGVMLADGGWALNEPEPEWSWSTVQVLLGLLILVQGFETSRFLGDEYDAEMRIRTMRRAQLIAAGIYVAFFALMGAVLPQDFSDSGVAEIIDLVAPVAAVLPLLLTIAALASQFSASVADSIGAAGLIHEIADGRISIRHAYPVIALVAIGVIWATNIYGVISLASRAFALFYLAQCGVAGLVAWRSRDLPRRGLNLALFGALAVICLAVVIFAAPFDG